MVVYATDASTLWTISIGLYFFIIIFCESLKVGERIIPLFYVISWGIPIPVVAWLLLSGLLGMNTL